MEVKLLDNNNPTQVAVIGRVDTVTAPEFQTQMETILTDYPQDIVLDCAELNFLSSAGLRALFVVARKAKALSATVTLRSVATNVREVLKISGFDSFFNVV